MHSPRLFPLSPFLLVLLLVPPEQAQQAAAPRLPEIHQLMLEVHEHQKQLDKVRENYTYTSLQTTQEIDANGQVKKTETQEWEEFFVNSHQIARLVKKDGKPLTDEEQEKEAGRVTKMVEKAEKTPPDQPLEGQGITIGRLLEIMDVRNPRREKYRGRAAIVFDFVGRKDAKTHGLAEDVSKKLRGTMWVDEADRQVAHVDVVFDENFHIAGGLVANIQQGSNFHFDQAPVNGELWLPTGVDFSVEMRLLLVKGIHQHFTERDSDYKRFSVETEQGKDAKAVAEKKQ
jgi:hypothetical protein